MMSKDHSSEVLLTHRCRPVCLAVVPFPRAMRVLCATLALGATAAVSAVASEEDAAVDIAARLDGLDLGIKSVKASKMAGIYEVEVDGGTLYVSQDGGYLIAGSLYEVRDGGLVNLTEETRSRERRELIGGLDESEFIAFTPDAGPEASVLVFTDTDCGYCRRLHQDMEEYHARGIEVRYLAFPRAGIGSPTYDKMVSAWCSDDPKGALTALKRGEGIPEKYCENHPVGAQYELGQSVGITGTPAIILPDGKILPGYVPADQLAALLGL